MVVPGQACSPSLMNSLRLWVRCDGEPFGEVIDPLLPRKASTRGCWLPVPQTDTGGQVENTEESERIVVKELGKMPP